MRFSSIWVTTMGSMIWRRARRLMWSCAKTSCRAYFPGLKCVSSWLPTLPRHRPALRSSTLKRHLASATTPTVQPHCLRRLPPPRRRSRRCGVVAAGCDMRRLSFGSVSIPGRGMKRISFYCCALRRQGESSCGPLFTSVAVSPPLLPDPKGKF